jgi:hypothetical protein
MPRLLILGDDVKPHSNRPYRGVYRLSPGSIDFDQFGKDHPVTKAFEWWLGESAHDEEAHGLVRNLKNAQDLVRTYQQYVADPFEVVEVTLGDEPTPRGKTLIGFDISLGFHSSLLWETRGLDICHRYRNWYDKEAKVILRQLDPLICLMQDYFRPKLNQYGLLPNHTSAKKCLSCVLALQSFVPDFFGYGINNWKVVGLYEVE